MVVSATPHDSRQRRFLDTDDIADADVREVPALDHPVDRVGADAEPLRDLADGQVGARRFPASAAAAEPRRFGSHQPEAPPPRPGVRPPMLAVSRQSTGWQNLPTDGTEGLHRPSRPERFQRFAKPW